MSSHDTPVPRVLLLLPTATYRAPDFLAAARALGVEVVVGSEQPQAMAGSMGDRAVVVPLDDPEAAVEADRGARRAAPLDAVVAVDDQGVLVAAKAAARLGLPHNPPDAVAATRDKAAMRRAFAAAGVPQPRFEVIDGEPTASVGFPCVVKPVSLSASRGVIRADDPAAATAAAARVRAMVDGPLLVEEYVPGVEVAVEGLLRDGRLEVLAVFDKPDPLDGPYFEETIYVTPSRLAPELLATIERVTAEPPPRSGSRKAPSTPSCGSTGIASWCSRSRRARSAGCARGRCASAPASASRRSSCATRSGSRSTTSVARRRRRA